MTRESVRRLTLCATVVNLAKIADAFTA
jgi:hypothetical protein